MKKLTQDEVLKKFEEVHGKKYTYTNTAYKGQNSPVLVMCENLNEYGSIHGEFSITPKNHFLGFGCKKCSGKYSPTTDEFILELQKIHGERYDYSEVVYTGRFKKVTIICREHGRFSQAAGNHLAGSKCPKCEGKYTPTTEEWVSEMKLQRGHEGFDYSEVVYIRMAEPVWITCKEGHRFQQTPVKHQNGRGCWVCAGVKLKTTKEWTSEMESIRDYTDYSKVNYVSNKIPVTLICKASGHEYQQQPNGHSSRMDGCPYCSNLNSRGQLEVQVFIESLGFDTTAGYRIPDSRKTLDIFIPSAKLGIEYDGLYWHSEGVHSDKLNLIAKTKLCGKSNISLIHILENEWDNPIKRDVWKSILSNKLGKSKRIFARNCKLVDITKQAANEFLESNHLQGSCNGGGSNLGLELNGELMALMVIGQARFSSHDYELLRFSCKKFTTVVGGASKLFKHFVKTTPSKSIVSYADKRLSKGNLYSQLGFQFTHESKPSYYYFKGLELYNRMQFQKHKLVDKLKKFDPKLSEWENMKNNGYGRIFDCGNSVWVYKTN